MAKIGQFNFGNVKLHVLSIGEKDFWCLFFSLGSEEDFNKELKSYN